MMNPPSRASVLATLMMGLYLIPPVHIQAQIVADVPSVASFTELQQVLDAAWVDRTTSALYPPGLTYTNSLPLIAVEAGFDQAFLAALQAGATPGGIALRKGIVREDLAGRLWFGSSATPVATTTFPVGYDPVQWVLDTFPPPPGTTGNDLDDYIADRRLTRQAMAFSLIAAADVPAYEAELQARFAAAAAAAANLGEEDIGMIHVELTPPSGPMEILVRAPFWVDYLGVYETRDLMNPFPWTPLGTVPHTFDPMAWSYPLPGDLRYVILANHMVDNDGDGILDAIERLVLGTDPENWDSDGDGVGDYPEVFIFESNPLQGGAGGVGDQIRLGLGIENPDMTKVVSGPVELRHKTWRAERSKTGFEGLKTPSTFFSRMTGRVEMGGVYKATMSGQYDIDKQDNRAQTTETDPLRHPSKNTCVVLPENLAGMRDDWGIGNGVGLWYPQPGDGVATINSHVLISTPVQVTLPVPMTYAAINEVTLSEEYTDSVLRWKTLLDVLSVRMICAPLDWGGGRRLIRPMPWATDANTGQAAFDPNPQDVSAGTRAERLADTIGLPPVNTGLQLQQMAFQATSLDETFPSDHLLRTVLLEVHRSQPDNPAEEGAVTMVVPKPVYLKHGTPAWESMIFEMPPPVENGTVEMVDGYADLVLPDTPEHMELSDGNFRVTGQAVPFRVELLEIEHLKAQYRLQVKGPIGSQPQLKAQGSATWAGPILNLDEGIINGLSEVNFALMTDVPGRYTVLLQVQGSKRNTSGLLIETGEEVSVDEIAITSVGVTFVKLWETDNKANQIFNPTRKDDPVYDDDPDLNGDTYGVPLNFIYMVAEPDSGKYQVTLKVETQPLNSSVRLHAVACVGDQVVSGSLLFPFESNMECKINFLHPGWATDIEDFTIKVVLDQNNNGHYDQDPFIPCVVMNTMTNMGIGDPMVKGSSGSRYSSAKDSVDNIIDGDLTLATYLVLPHAKRLLQIFRDGNALGLPTNKQPTSYTNINFNAFTTTLSEWLTHNSGAPFDANGNTLLTEYSWDRYTSLADLVAGASQVQARANAFYYQEIYPIAIEIFETLPVGSTLEFPSTIGEGFDVAHTSESPEWVGPGAYTKTFDDILRPNLLDDLNGSIGRGRLLQHKVRYKVEKQISGVEQASNLVLVEMRSWGEVVDIYDFNHDCGGKSRDAAILQIGYGNGSHGSPRNFGVIYLDRIKFDKIYMELP